MSEPITNVEAAVRELGALPVPVGDDRTKAPWGRAEDGRPLLPMGAHWTDVPELLDQRLADVQARVNEAQSGNWYVAPATELGLAQGTVRTRVGGYPRTVGQFTTVLPADLEFVLHAHADLSWCLEMIAKFRARVAELEAERHTTNEALDDAAKSLREQRDRIAGLEESPLEWSDRLDSKSLDNFLICLAQATEYEPINGAVDEIHQVIRSFREHVESTPLVDQDVTSDASRQLPTRDAVCGRTGCGHAGADHHHAGAKCWATLPRQRGRNGAWSAVESCYCDGFIGDANTDAGGA